MPEDQREWHRDLRRLEENLEKLERVTGELRILVGQVERTMMNMNTDFKVLANELSYVKMIVFGFAGMVLTAFVGALIFFVFRGTP